MRAVRNTVVLFAALVAVFVLVGAAHSSLRTISVKEIVPGVPGWAVGAAVAFGVVVGGGFMVAQGAVRSRAAARGLGGEYAPDAGPLRSAAATRALSSETAAFVQDEGAYKSALLKRLGAAGPTVPTMPGVKRARYAPCANCTMPMRFAPGESSAKCVKCGRTSTLPDADEDEE